MASDLSMILRPIVLSECVKEAKAYMQILKFTEWVDYILIIQLNNKAWQFIQMTNTISPDKIKVRKFPTENLCLKDTISFISKLRFAITKEDKKKYCSLREKN